MLICGVPEKLPQGTCAVVYGAVVYGAAKCWGSGFLGLLGNASTLDQLLPTQVSGFPSGVKKIFAGGYNACLLTIGGALHCWGSNGNLLLTPNFSFSYAKIPMAISGASSGIVDAAVGSGIYGGNLVCFVTEDNVGKCLGSRTSMGLGGDGSWVSRTPTEVLFP